MKLVQFCIDVPDRERLVGYAKEDGRSLSCYIRNLVRKHLEERKSGATGEHA